MMVSNAATNRTADPWPRWPVNSLEWDIFEWSVIRRVLFYERYLAAHPPRPFPAKLWVEEREEKQPLRIDTAKLPVFHLSFWMEEQRERQEQLAEEWRQALAEQQPIRVRIPRPRRKIGWFERQLDKLIAWRTGANKVRPDRHVYQKSASTDESWLI